MSEFTKRSKEYDKGRSGEDIGFWAEETERFARLDCNSLVLDMGCGTGLYTLGINTRTSATMCGIDPSEGMLKQERG